MEAIIKIEGKHRNVMLGTCYEHGLGVEKDQGKAADQFLLAAESGDAEGQYLYAICLKEGLGVVKNPATANEYFEMAAKLKYQPAIDALTPPTPPNKVVWTCKNIREILAGPVDKYYWSEAYKVGGDYYYVGIRTSMQGNKKYTYVHVQCRTAEKDFSADFQINDKAIWTAKALQEQNYLTKNQLSSKCWDISTFWNDFESLILPDGSVKVSVTINLT